jgi:hypothetical protein
MRKAVTAIRLPKGFVMGFEVEEADIDAENHAMGTVMGYQNLIGFEEW